MRFSEAIDWTVGGDGEYRGEVDASWAQGRTIFGGLLSAIALRATRAVVPIDRRPRELHTRFLLPAAAGSLRLALRVLHRGRSAFQVQAHCGAEESPTCLALASFGAPRVSAVRLQPGPRMPQKAPDRLQPLPFIPGVTPVFTEHVDYRPAHGAMPFTGAQEPRIGGWCRLKEPDTPGPETVVALLDAWPAPALAAMRAPAPASTVAWSVFFHRPPAVAPPGWWWFEAEVTAAAEGYAATCGSLFAPDGSLAGTMQQSVALYG